MTAETIPSGSRPAARVLLFDQNDRLLLLQAEEASGAHRWWVAPGGGLQPGETFEAAAQRELYEETGLLLPIGIWTWTRRHVFDFEGRSHDQYERFFISKANNPRIVPVRPDSYVAGHRWWDLASIQRSEEEFAPRQLGALLPAILRGEYPDPPIDCGV